MKKEIVQLIKHSGIYGIGVALSKSVGFFMIPVYTRYLVPRDYGILELLDVVLFASTTFAAMGVFGAIFRFYAAYESEDDKKEVIGTALIFTVGTSILISLGLVYWAPIIADIYLGDASLAQCVRIVGCTFFFTNMSEVPMAYWRAQGRTVLFVSLGLGRTIMAALNLVVFLVILKMGILGALYANLLTNSIWGLALCGVVLASIPWRIKRDKLEKMLNYGIPTVAWSVGGFILTFSDRIFLRYYASLSEVGVYALGYKMARIVPIVITGPFNMAWQWQQFELAKRENARQIIARVGSYLLMAATMVCLGISVLAKDILRIMVPASYWGAAAVVPLIAASYLLFNLQLVVISGIYIQRVTSRLAVVAAATAGLNLALNYLLIPQFHIMGAAVATWLSYAGQLALSFVAAQSCYHVPYQYKRNAIILGSATFIYFVSTLPTLDISVSVVFNLILVAAFSGICYLLLEAREKQIVQQWMLSAHTGLRRVWLQAR